MNKLPLRVRLPLLVAGTMLPLILFAAGVVYFNHARERDAAFDRVLETVRAIQLVLDTEMQGVARALEVLADAQSLQRDDLQAFRTNVNAFLQHYPETSAISLADREGRQLLNSRLAAEQPLPPRINRESIDEIFRTKRAAFSNLFVSSVTGRRIIAVSVPVIRSGDVVYEIAFNPPFELFQRLIYQQLPSGDWTMSIFDRTGTNVARVPNPEQTVGLKASPTLLPAILSQTEGKLTTHSLEGVELLTAFTRSPLTGWTVAAGIPVTSLTAPLWRQLAITASVGTVLLAIGLAFSIGMAARIARGEMLHGLLINELNHRVKNTLATVQSIASQTFRPSADAAEARRKFEARLGSLGRTHNVLSDEKWENAEIREIIDSVLEPYAAKDSARLRISGPDNIRLAPGAAVMMSMVLHELATNAAKYGALANGAGRILINWTANGGKLCLRWKEIGGPPVLPADRKGFGSKLIEEAFAAQVGGSGILEYNAEGIVCVLECPHL